MEISPRLKKIAELIGKSFCIADVGTDHGYIPVYCFQHNMIQKAVAMDINPMPLDRARKNIAGYGFSDRTECRLSDGLDELSAGEADTIIIAGMGGLLMIDILKRGKAVLCPNTRLILQPMIATYELRTYLYQNGFCIDNEYVVREENKFYNILSVTLGNMENTPESMLIGKNLKENSPLEFDAYIAYKMRICKKKIDGNKRAVVPDRNLVAKLEWEYAEYNQYLGGAKQ